jgi:hypothetical protein
MMLYTCYPRYTGGLREEGEKLRLAPGKNMIPFLKNT